MDYNTYLPLINSMSQQNNVFNAEQVQKQMDFQKMMSDTAHQREVADLKKAGLNPVLSAGGSGAAAMQGAAASADNSNVAALSNILGTVLNNENARAIADMNNSAAAKLQAQSDSAAMDRAMFSAKQNERLQSQKIQAERDLQDAKLDWQAAQNKLDRLEKDKDRKNTKEYQDAQLELKRREVAVKEAELALSSIQLSNVSSGSRGSGTTNSSDNIEAQAQQYPENVLGAILRLGHDYVYSLSDKGSTKILGITVPNKFIKLYWDNMFEDMYQDTHTPPVLTNPVTEDKKGPHGGTIQPASGPINAYKSAAHRRVENMNIRALQAK